MPDLIPPGERRELRSVVRQQFKVLRTEVKQREYELIAEAEARLTERYREDDAKGEALNFRARMITDEANRALEAAMEEAGFDRGTRSWKQYSTPTFVFKPEARNQLHRTLISGIRAQVSEAQMTLNRQEADLLRSLAMEALETDAARMFLGRIPTVAALVPSSRLREIERSFDNERAAS